MIYKFLNLMGFNNVEDLIGSQYDPKIVNPIAIGFGTTAAFIETWTGLSIFIWMFLTLGTLFDIAFGVYANIIILKSEFETEKFFRGIFKAFIVLLLIPLTNTLNMGVQDSNIESELIRTSFTYIAASIHYGFVMLVALYLLTGISENGEKIGIPAFKSLNKILRLKIKKVENLTS